MHVAAAKSDLQMLELLVEEGADVNSTDAQGYTPMIGAIGVLSYDKVLFLREHGASLNVRNETNLVTSLMAAVSGEHVELVKLCLENGCDVREKDKVQDSVQTHF